MKIAIIGSRNFRMTVRIRAKVRQIAGLSHLGDPITIISGGASGVDTEAVRNARELGLVAYDIKPDMSAEYDVKQFHIRNDKIIAEADKVIAFWDGESKGTESVILKCLQRHKNFEVIFD